jgi:hypothetical protein
MSLDENISTHTFVVGLTTLLRQKIAELGMAGNKSPGPIDWAIVPDIPTSCDQMDIDSPLDEWEDIIEDDLGAEGHEAFGQMAARYTRMQSIITCVVISSAFSTISEFPVGLLVAANDVLVQPAHDFFAVVQLSESGWLSCNPSSTLTLRGHAIVSPALRWNPIMFGQYLCLVLPRLG